MTVYVPLCGLTHLCQIAQERQRKRVHLQVLDPHLDTRDATGRLLFNMLGAMAQFETEIRAERQIDGVQKAKERGVRFGAKKKLTPKQVSELQQRREQGVRIQSLMQDDGSSKVSGYRYLSRTDSALSTQNASFLIPPCQGTAQS